MAEKRLQQDSAPSTERKRKEGRMAEKRLQQDSDVRMNTGGNLYIGLSCVSYATRCIGTVGIFLEDNSGRTAFLTSAHSVVPYSLLNINSEERQQYLLDNAITVCINGQMREKIGMVINWCFFEGTENQKCVDVALVEVDKQRISTENMFPQIKDDDWKSAGYHPYDQPRISENEILTFKELNDKTVFGSTILKFGYTSRVSLGHFVYDGACIKVHNNVGMSYREDENIVMHGLVAVQGFFGRQFSEPGDAGALCSIVDARDRTKLYPFGMVVGNGPSGVTYVALLDNALKMLNLDLGEGIKLYPFSDPPLRHKQTF